MFKMLQARTVIDCDENKMERKGFQPWKYEAAKHEMKIKSDLKNCGGSYFKRTKFAGV